MCALSRSFFKPASLFLFLVSLAILPLSFLHADPAEAPAGPEAPPPLPIVRKIDVEFVGPNSLNRQRVLDNLVTKVGLPFNVTLSNEDVKNLYATGEVSNAQVFAEPFQDGVKVIVQIRGRPKVEEVVVEGSSVIPPSKIKKEIGIQVGDVYSEERLSEDRQKILKMYEDRNYTDVKVDASAQEIKGTKRMRVVFKIKEGAKLVVRHIRFEGNFSIKSKMLREVMRTKRANILSFLTKDGRLLPAQVREDEEAIVDLYQNHGFADAKVTDIKPERDASGDGITLVVSIKEGPQYHLHQVGIEGVHIVSAATLLSKLTMKDGDLYTPNGMNNDIKTIQTFYGSKGYANMSILPEITSVSPGVINLTYKIEEGGQSYVNLISIEGNTKTKDQVIRREMEVMPGDLYDTEKVDRSRRTLMNLNYFSNVAMVPEDTMVPGRKDIKVVVDEKKTGDLHFGAGFNSIYSLVGFAQLQQSNFDLFNWPTFSGGGQRFQARAQYGVERSDFTVSLTEPWFLGYKLSLGGEFYYHQASFLSPVYQQSNLGAAITLRKPLTKLLSGTLEYRPEQVRIFDVNSSVPNDSPIKINSDSGSYFSSRLTGSVGWDRRDSIFLPRKGEQVSLSVSGAGKALGGDVQDYGWTLNGKKYFSLPFDGILEFKGAIASINSYGGGSKGVDTPPIFDELYLGGINSLRGFFFRQVSPVDSGNNPIGGNSSAYGTIETTFPVVPRVRAAIFTDWGFVNPNSYDYSTNLMCGDVGIGAILQLPIGPLRVYWGYPVKSQDYNSSNGQFQVAAGSDF